jgi:hypothetical protein
VTGTDFRASELSRVSILPTDTTTDPHGLSFPPGWGRFFWRLWLGTIKTKRPPTEAASEGETDCGTVYETRSLANRSGISSKAGVT